MPQGFATGVYRGLTERSYFVLQPHLTYEFTPKSPTETSKGRTVSVYSERPKYIRVDLVEGLDPLRDEHFAELARGNTLETEDRGKFNNFLESIPEYQI